MGTASAVEGARGIIGNRLFYPGAESGRQRLRTQLDMILSLAGSFSSRSRRFNDRDKGKMQALVETIPPPLIKVMIRLTPQ